MKKFFCVILSLFLVVLLSSVAFAEENITDRYTIGEATAMFGLNVGEFDTIETISVINDGIARSEGANNKAYKCVKVNGDNVEVHILGLYRVERPDYTNDNVNGAMPAAYVPWDPFTEVIIDTYYLYSSSSIGNKVYYRPSKVGMYVGSVDSDVSAIAVGYKINGSVYNLSGTTASYDSSATNLSVTCTYNNPIEGESKYSSYYNNTRGVSSSSATGTLALQLKFVNGTTTNVASMNVEP